jgi:hypothetical protein
MMTDPWLEKWLTVYRLRPAERVDLSMPPAPALPLEDTKYILKHGKKAWRARQAAEGVNTP